MIYIDLDGVLNKFEDYLKYNNAQKSQNAFLGLCYRDAEIFLNTEVNTDVLSCLFEFGINDVRILSALPSLKDFYDYGTKNNYYNIFDIYNNLRHNKLKFCISNGIPIENVIILTSRRDKVLYAKNSLLVDDYLSNIKDFVSNGGVGLHFTTGVTKARLLEVLERFRRSSKSNEAS